MWVTICACLCTQLPGFPLTARWVNPQAKVPEGVSVLTQVTFFQEHVPSRVASSPPRQHASTGAPHLPAATTLLNLPQATLTGDVLAHNGLFLLVLHPAGTGCDWPRAVPDLFPHRLFCSPCYPKTASYVQYMNASSMPLLQGTVATCLSCCNSVAVVSTKIWNWSSDNKDASCFNH